MNLRTGKVVNYRNVPGVRLPVQRLRLRHLPGKRRHPLRRDDVRLCTFDKRRGRFSRVKITEGRFIYDIAEDTGGNIWVASKVSGIYRYSPGDRDLEKLPPRRTRPAFARRRQVHPGLRRHRRAGLVLRRKQPDLRYDPRWTGSRISAPTTTCRTASTTACWTTARATCGSPPTKASSNTTPSCTPAHATRSRTDSRATSSISGRRTKPGTERSSSGE